MNALRDAMALRFEFEPNAPFVRSLADLSRWKYDWMRENRGFTPKRLYVSQSQWDALIESVNGMRMELTTDAMLTGKFTLLGIEIRIDPNAERRVAAA